MKSANIIRNSDRYSYCSYFTWGAVGRNHQNNNKQPSSFSSMRRTKHCLESLDRKSLTKRRWITSCRRQTFGGTIDACSARNVMQFSSSALSLFMVERVGRATQKLYPTTQVERLFYTRRTAGRRRYRVFRENFVRKSLVAYEAIRANAESNFNLWVRALKQRRKTTEQDVGAYLKTIFTTKMLRVVVACFIIIL